MTSPSELSPRDEILSDAELNTLLNGPGNHEMQTLLTGIIANDPDNEFTASQLYTEVKQRQAGQTNGWITHSEGPAGACRNTLTPIGLVTKEAAIGRGNKYIDAWKATDFARQALPFVGAISEWSLKYPDYSIQQILGSTVSRNGVRSPAIRHALYQTLVTAPDGEQPSYSDIVESIDDEAISTNLIASQCRDLEDLGIVKIVSKLSDDYNPSFQIERAAYEHVAIQFNDLAPASQVAYTALEKLSALVGPHSLSDLLKVAHEISPDTDPRLIRRLFTMGLSEKTSNMPGIKLIDGQMPPEQRTIVSITDEYQPMLQDLIERLAAVKDGGQNDYFAAKAKEILNSPELFARLMGKAKRFSPAYMGQVEGREGLEHQLTDTVRRLGGGTAKAIRQQLEESGRRLTRDTVQAVLGELASKGALHAEQRQTEASKRSSTMHYSVVDTIEDDSSQLK